MSGIETAYLIGVIVAFIAFIAVLAYESLASDARPLEPGESE
jgi:hypothetical protein